MCMTNETIESKAREVKELLRMREELEAEIASLQDELKAELTERNTSELIVGEYKIRYKDVASNRFDTTSFKAKYEELYKQFVNVTLYDSWIEELQEEIEYIEDIKSDIDGEAEDTVNYRLAEFYDFCDDLRIWLPA